MDEFGVQDGDRASRVGAYGMDAGDDERKLAAQSLLELLGRAGLSPLLPRPSHALPPPVAVHPTIPAPSSAPLAKPLGMAPACTPQRSVAKAIVDLAKWSASWSAITATGFLVALSYATTTAPVGVETQMAFVARGCWSSVLA